MSNVADAEPGKRGITMIDLFLIMTMVSLVLAFIGLTTKPTYDGYRTRNFFEAAFKLAAGSATPCYYLQDGLRFEGKCFSHGPYNVLKAGDRMLVSKQKFNGETPLSGWSDRELTGYVDAKVNP